MDYQKWILATCDLCRRLGVCHKCTDANARRPKRMLAGPNDIEGFLLSLAIALFCLGQGTTGIGDDGESSGFLTFLRENAC